MSDWLVVLLQIAAMFLVILVGWVARHRAYLTGETTATLSKFVVDLTLPALVFTSMLGAAANQSLRANWYIPLVGAGIILLGGLVGLLVTPLFAREGRPTVVFLVAVANWVYLPLPIAQALYGEVGRTAVVLVNIGATVVLWTLGVWLLRGGKPDRDSLRALATNPGLIAAVAGVLIAIVAPSLGAVTTMPANQLAGVMLPLRMVTDALTMLGSLTIPLSLVVTGAQLGGLDISAHQPSRRLTGTIISRLLVAPVVTIGALALLHRAWAIPTDVRLVLYIIAAMPAAISCSIFTDRYGGDTSLAARTIFYSTLLSIGTVPLVFFLAQRMGL